MTVYVDDMRASYQPPHRPGRRYVMSHMMADTLEELHSMADQIGVARRWFQGGHYDVTQTKKLEALRRGAVECTTREMVSLRRRLRETCRTSS